MSTVSVRKKQLSVQANDQLNLARTIEAAALSLAGKTQEALLREVPPILAAGESPPDLNAASHFAARWLDWRRDRLEQAESRYASELRGDQRLRERRDESIQTLIDNLRVVQVQLDLAVGKGRSASFAGFSTGLQALDPPMLMRVARDAVVELRRESFGLTRAKAAAANLSELARSIDEPLARLKEVLDELPASLRETESALQVKQAELELLRRDIRRVSAFLGGFLRLVGLDFHADRLRPKTPVNAPAEDAPPLGGVPAPAGAPDAAANTNLPPTSVAV